MIRVTAHHAYIYELPPDAVHAMQDESKGVEGPSLIGQDTAAPIVSPAGVGRQLMLASPTSGVASLAEVLHCLLTIAERVGEMLCMQVVSRISVASRTSRCKLTLSLLRSSTRTSQLHSSCDMGMRQST